MTGNQQKTSTALCVSVSPTWRAALSEMFEVLDANSAAEALRTLKLFAIDLLVVSADMRDEPFWSLVSRIRRARPSLAWILIGEISDAEEVRARCLGVLAILGPDVSVAMNGNSLQAACPTRMADQSVAVQVG